MKDFPDFLSKNLNIKSTLSKIVDIREDERTKARTILSLLTVSLLIVLVSSLGIIQYNTAIAASNTIFKERFKDSFARAAKITTEGSITTQVSAEAHKDLSGNTVVTLFLIRTDESTYASYPIFRLRARPTNDRRWPQFSNIFRHCYRSRLCYWRR